MGIFLQEVFKFVAKDDRDSISNNYMCVPLYKRVFSNGAKIINSAISDIGQGTTKNEIAKQISGGQYLQHRFT